MNGGTGAVNMFVNTHEALFSARRCSVVPLSVIRSVGSYKAKKFLC